MDMYTHNIARHEARAAYWMEMGNEDYAAGSLLKADKWRTQQRNLDMLLHGARPMTARREFLDRRNTEAARTFAAEIEAAIFG